MDHLLGAGIRPIFAVPMNYKTTDRFASIETHSCLSLHKCVNKVITGLLPGTNTITNDVIPGIFVSTDKAKLTDIISLLLNTIVSNSENSGIHITAKLVGSITLLYIKSNDARSDMAIAGSLRYIESLAETLGGCVTLSTSKIYGLAITFTFVNH